jgi:5-methylcytosine-specific restriction enzyme A
LTMEHVIPIARGGKSDRKNCVPCCKDCNTKKAAKTKVEIAFSEGKSGKNSSE